MAKAKMIQVVQKAITRFGKTFPAQATEYAVEVIKNQSISIFRNGELKNTFSIGDDAEYDSYNLSYFGRITSISETTVCVQKTGGSKAFMDLYKFCWRNENFEAERAEKQNSETMMYI